MNKQKQDYENLSPSARKTLETIVKSGYTPKEVEQFIEALNRKESYKHGEHKVGRSHVKIGVFGDPHIGNIQYDPSMMKYFAKETKNQKVDFVLCTGDIFDGWYQNRPASIFEQNAVGFDKQMKMATEEMSQIEVPIYFITGNHSYNTYVRNAGIEAGPVLEDRLTKKGLEAKYLGNAEGDIKLKNGAKIKLLHPDGGTAYAICFDDKTEILTENGWKLFNLLNKKEKVATLNLEKDEFQWQLPTEYIEDEYNGELLHFNAKTFDLMVTPNHRMLVRRYPYSLKCKQKLRFPNKSHGKISTDWTEKPAQELINVNRQAWQMKRDVSNWEGELVKQIFIPERRIKKYGTRQSPRIEYINIDNIAELIGWYVTEGYIRKSQISIAQYKNINPLNYSEIIDLIKRIGFAPREEKRKQHINIWSLELAEWLINECGNGSRNKFIPQWLKNQPKNILQILFDTMIKGDGWKNNKGWGYRSISERLLDDFSEISIKLGYAVTQNKDSLSISSIQTKPTINNRPNIINYQGKIYCVSVPNTFIMVRRNGKAIWSGNSYRPQKIIESLTGGEKPNILLIGHFHKLEQLFYRNVHAYQTGTFEGQTKFMRGKNIPAHKGFWILDVHGKARGGIDKIISQLYTIYN